MKSRSEDFRQRVARTGILRRVYGVAAIVFLVFSALGLALSSITAVGWVGRGVLLLSLPAFLIFLGVFFYHRRLRCPACNQRLFDRFGGFCPECGSRALGPPDPCDLLSQHPCAACGRKFHWGKTATGFRLRYCSSCGVLLDERGLGMP